MAYTDDDEAPVDISEAMAEAGEDVINDWSEILDPHSLAQKIYAAMARIAKSEELMAEKLRLVERLHHVDPANSSVEINGVTVRVFGNSTMWKS